MVDIQIDNDLLFESTSEDYTDSTTSDGDNKLIIRDDTATSRDSMNSTNSFAFDLFTEKANQISSDAKNKESALEEYTIIKSFELASEKKSAMSIENQIRNDLGETYLFETQVVIDSDISTTNKSIQGKLIFGVIALLAIGITLFVTLRFRRHKRRT